MSSNQGKKNVFGDTVNNNVDNVNYVMSTLNQDSCVVLSIPQDNINHVVLPYSLETDKTGNTIKYILTYALSFRQSTPPFTKVPFPGDGFSFFRARFVIDV